MKSTVLSTENDQRLKNPLSFVPGQVYVIMNGYGGLFQKEGVSVFESTKKDYFVVYEQFEDDSKFSSPIQETDDQEDGFNIKRITFHLFEREKNVCRFTGKSLDLEPPPEGFLDQTFGLSSSSQLSVFLYSKSIDPKILIYDLNSAINHPTEIRFSPQDKNLILEEARKSGHCISPITDFLFLGDGNLLLAVGKILFLLSPDSSFEQIRKIHNTATEICYSSLKYISPSRHQTVQRTEHLDDHTHTVVNEKNEYFLFTFHIFQKNEEIGILYRKRSTERIDHRNSIIKRNTSHSLEKMKIINLSKYKFFGPFFRHPHHIFVQRIQYNSDLEMETRLELRTFPEFKRVRSIDLFSQKRTTANINNTKRKIGYQNGRSYNMTPKTRKLLNYSIIENQSSPSSELFWVSYHVNIAHNWWVKRERKLFLRMEKEKVLVQQAAGKMRLDEISEPIVQFDEKGDGRDGLEGLVLPMDCLRWIFMFLEFDQVVRKVEILSRGIRRQSEYIWKLLIFYHYRIPISVDECHKRSFKNKNKNISFRFRYLWRKFVVDEDVCAVRVFMRESRGFVNNNKKNWKDAVVEKNNLSFLDEEDTIGDDLVEIVD